jgi:Ca2+-binding EF-hand superfamily protein
MNSLGKVIVLIGVIFACSSGFDASPVLEENENVSNTLDSVIPFKEEFDKADLDRDGYLTLKELIQVTEKEMGATKCVSRASFPFDDEYFDFERMDKNGDGELCPDEVRQDIEDSLKRRLAQIDKNGDQLLSFEEFYDFIKNFV